MRCRVWLACATALSGGCEILFRTDSIVVVDADMTRPIFLSATAMHAGPVTSESFVVTVPPAGNRYLIVSVGIGDFVSSGAAVSMVTYDGTPLTSFVQISGVPNIDSTAVTAQWQLVAPDVGTHTITITLAPPGHTLHASAMVFANVNQQTPIRATAQLAGNGSSAQVMITSAPNDLVESVVGHGGDGIGSAGIGQTARFVDNATNGSTLDNAAGSTAPGAASVTMSWTMLSSDVWQEVAASLQP